MDVHSAVARALSALGSHLFFVLGCPFHWAPVSRTPVSSGFAMGSSTDLMVGGVLLRVVAAAFPRLFFLPLRSSRLHRLGYLSIAIHHDFHFIALLRSSTVDDIYAAGHAVSDSCLLLSFASLNYLKIFNF